MTVLDRLDATRLCSRWSPPDDPSVWARPIPVATPSAVAVLAPVVEYSWRSLARNPNALVLTGMVGTVMIKDAMLRLLAAR